MKVQRCPRPLLLPFLLLLLLPLQTAWGFLCYSRGVGSDYTGVTFCPTWTCFSVGGSVLGNKDAQKGCSEEKISSGCLAVSLPSDIASAHTCYCNSFLCNAATPLSRSSGGVALLLPLLLALLSQHPFVVAM